MKIVITGSKGTIGSIVSQKLATSHEVTGLDLPDHDLATADLTPLFAAADIVIHLAHARGDQRENPRTGLIDPRNVSMEMNVFTTAVETRVRRLIMASSVHADDFLAHSSQHLLTIPGSMRPASPYGAHKLIIEAQGQFYSQRFGLEFIGLRFGGVTPDNRVKTFGKEPEVWLSHRDLGAALIACVDAPSVPNNYVVFNVVSNNAGRIHDTTNPFGWKPVDNSRDHSD